MSKRIIISILSILSFNIWSAECVDQEPEKLSCEEAAAIYLEELCSRREEVPLTGDEETDKHLKHLYGVYSLSGLRDEKGLEKLDQEGISYDKKGLKDCVEIADISPVNGMVCFEEWRYNEGMNAMFEIEKLNLYQEAKGWAKKSLDKVSNKFLTSLETPWYFQLDPNTKENLPMMNGILKKLAGVVTSPKSSKSIRKEILSMQEHEIFIQDLGDPDPHKLNAGNLLFPKGKIDLFGVLSLNLSSGRRLVLFKQFILQAMNKNKHAFLDFVMAHEVAHNYTSSAEVGVGGRLSKDSRKRIKSRHRACLYKEGEAKEKFAEDLADLIAASIFAQLEHDLSGANLDSFSKGFCHFSRGHSDDGHSPGGVRFQNFVKYSEKAQKALGCKEERIVCTIRTTPLTGNEKTY